MSNEAHAARELARAIEHLYKLRFTSQSAAEKALSGTGKNSSAIHHCFIGKKQSAYGFRWERA